MMNCFIKPLAISLVTLGLLVSNATYASKNDFRPIYTLKSLSHLQNVTTGSDLNIQLSDKLLLSQVVEAINTFQQQGITFNHIKISAEDGLTVNLNEPFFVNLSGILSKESTLEVASGVGISTDPDTLLTLSKLPLYSLQIDPSAYQSAFSAAPDAAAQKINIQFGTLDQVDAFNRAIFYGNVILNQQAFKLTGTVPALTRFLANLNKPINKKVLFGELDLNFISGQATDELAKCLGGSTVHAVNLLQVRLGSSLSFEQASLYQTSFGQEMNAVVQEGGTVVPRIAIYSQKTINWSSLVNSYVQASGGDSIIFITNGQLKGLLFDEMKNVTLITGNASKELFQAAEEGKIAGAFVLLETPAHTKLLENRFNNSHFIEGETPIGYLAGISQNKSILEII